MKFYNIACYIVAFKNGIGKTLVTGHKATYFKEAAYLTLKLNNHAILLQKRKKNILIPVLETEKDVYQITYNRFHTKEIFSMNRFDKKKEEFVEVSSESSLYKQGLSLARKMTFDSHSI